MCFVQKINDITSRELHGTCQHILEHGKGKTARQRLDEAMESLSDTSKNRISSAVEDVTNEQLKAQRFNSCNRNLSISTTSNSTDLAQDSAC